MRTASLCTCAAFLVPLSLAFDDMQGAVFTWFNAVNCVGSEHSRF
jgi:hypothetical protein